DVAALSGRRLATQGARHYRTHGAWSRLTDEAFAERRQALITRFQLTEADLAQETAGRGRGARTVTTASPAFLHRVYAWQLWQWRGQRPPNGLLAEEDLQALGVLAAAPEAPTTAGPETEADATTDEEAELPPPEPPAGADAPEDHGADLRLMRRSILEYLRNFNALRSVQPAAERDARRHALGEPWEGQLITYRAQLDAWQISGLDTNVLNRRTARGGQESVANWARRWVRSLDQFLTGTTTAPGAGGQAETVRGTAPVSRPADYQQGDDVGVHTVEEGEAWLGERDLTLREQSIEAQGWDPRLNHADGADEPVQEIAGRAVPALQSLRTRMSQAAHDLESALAREDDPSREHLRRVYTEIMGRDFAPPPTVRTPWRVNLPRESAARIAAWTPGQVLSHARQLRGRLAAEARRLEPEIRRNANYQGSIHMVNPHGVVVDLHRSGVDVCWGEGTPMEIEHFNLDPVFATAMFRYLETLRGMGVTKLWTSGFLRPHGTAISVLDAHPLGMACDITGFQFGSDPDGLIHLRGGFPMEPGNSRYDHWQRGHSDWYDERGTFNGRTHREIMLGMAEILPHYFGRIIGPGHNETHMNHFHVELFGNRRAGPALRAISEYGDMPEWTHPRADRLDPGWREGGR
ncbi:MAG: hypothetical protein KC549_16675, partial [Myxococcales bacterium]|nr:hypothetical protein [Myxococcales bacterium]